MLAIERDDLIVGATRAARLAFGITDATLARALPADTILQGPAEPAEAFETAERGVVQRALARAGGNVSAAAKTLGLSRATLHRKVKRLGLVRHA